METLFYIDQEQASFRFATFSGSALLGAVYIAPNSVAVSQTWAVEHLAASEILGAKRLRLLSGRPGVNQVDPGSIVCAFFSVGLNHIAAAVEASAMTVEGNGAAL